MSERPAVDSVARSASAFNRIRGTGAPLLAAVRLLRPSRAASPREALPGSLPEIATYHQLRAPQSESQALPRRVGGDLDLDLVFRRVDTSTSTVGQQVLYDLLHRPSADPAVIADRDSLIAELSGDPALRERICDAVAGLRGRGAYALPYLFAAPIGDRPRWWPLLPLLACASLLCMALSFVQPIALLALLVVVLVNMGVQASFRPTLERFVAPMAALSPLLAGARRIAGEGHAGVRAQVAGLKPACDRLMQLDGYARRFVRELNGNELAATLVGYANLFFLLDLNAFVFGIARVRRHRADLAAVFETVGWLDAACSIARFRESLPVWCAPSFTPAGKRIAARGLYHPLLTAPVPNDLCLDGQDLVVTGSNMAGKTTYLRAAGVAAVLAQSIATVPAESWTAPLVRVETLIARSDDLASGKSYFLVEAEIVRELVRSAGSPGQHLFIMDEIFRGTNTRERLSASAAVLRYLSRGNDLCLVATHDVELERLLDGGWTFWHFRESVGGDGMSFDYRVHAGVASAPNALRLLEASGYPKEITDDALAVHAALGNAVTAT